MKTSELIAALAADPVPEPVHLGRRLAAAVALGLVGALVLYGLVVGPRPDFAEALGTIRFDLKFVDALALALPSLLLLLRLMRPDAKAGALALWLFAPLVLLAAAVVAELIVVPQDEWLPRLVGQNMRYCTTMIPMMAAPILAALIVALRAGAPQHPGWTGALAGAAAAGLASFLYASHCPDDSPLFVATWYPLATLVCAAAGAWAGRRFLAW
ncbi:NrsF family protein [Roseiarcus sp.]|uniref:NrsF family protein n=1 Tax=Roseiarcus sp. TaxID=1969460 RepID=UPI003F988427